MQNKDELIKKLKKFGKEIVKDSDECKIFLMKAGIIDKHGDLTEPYRGIEE